MNRKLPFLKTALRVTLLGLSLVCLSGCISISLREGEEDYTLTWPKESDHAPTIGVTVTADAQLEEDFFYEFGSAGWQDDELQRVKNARVVAWATPHLLQALNNSRLFHEIQLGSQKTDLVAEFHIQLEKKYDRGWKSMALHTFTLSPIPLKERTRLTIHLSIKDRHGNPLGQYAATDRLSTWTSLLLFPFSPFWLWWHEPIEFVLALQTYHMIFTAHEEGVF